MARSRRATAAEERFEAAMRWLAADERGLLILGMLVAAVFDPPGADPNYALVDSGRRGVALDWWRAIVTHVPGSVASVVRQTTGGSDGNRGRDAGSGDGDRGADDAPGGYAYPGAHSDPDDRHAAAAALGDPDT